MSDVKLCPLKKAVNKSTEKVFPESSTFDVFLKCKRDMCAWWTEKGCAVQVLAIVIGSDCE
jgi:hypothetical protein